MDEEAQYIDRCEDEVVRLSLELTDVAAELDRYRVSLRAVRERMQRHRAARNQAQENAILRSKWTTMQIVGLREEIARLRFAMRALADEWERHEPFVDVLANEAYALHARQVRAILQPDAGGEG